MSAPSPREIRSSLLAIPLLVNCPHCWASAGERCYILKKKRTDHAKKAHEIRVRAAVRHLAEMLDESGAAPPRPCPATMGGDGEQTAAGIQAWG